jgi:hypothetical protein
MTDLNRLRKKNKAGDNPEEDVSDHVGLHDRIFDDNRLSNRIAELLFEILEEKNWTAKQVLMASLEHVMVAYKEKSDKEVDENVPFDVDVDPKMASNGVCGFNTSMAGMAFSPLVDGDPFYSWVYQIIKTHPYCFPLRSKTSLKLSGSVEHRIIVLSTTILGVLWNNKVSFGKDFPVKKPTDPAHDLPGFTAEVIDAVKRVIRDRARICRSNLGRGRGEKKRRS